MDKQLPTAPVPRPFLTWLGRKTRLVPRIAALLPPSARLVEPFAGSGAVFMGVERPRYLLADTNPDIVALYSLLASDPEGTIEAARSHFVPGNNALGPYNALRDRLNDLKPGDPERAAIFVYLNRHGFNGLCRYTRRLGRYNVHFGSKPNPRFPLDEIRAFAAKAPRAEFVRAHFGDTMAAAVPGDAVYCDPPYVHVAASKGYHTYGGGFRMPEQTELAEACAACAARGIPVLVSNHDTPVTRELYRDAEITEVTSPRSISCDTRGRSGVSEILALFR